jgi:hypothetical protein
MKHTALLTALGMLTLTACDKQPSADPFVPAQKNPMANSVPAGHLPIKTMNQLETINEAPKVEQQQKATVVSTIDIPQFTYLEISQNQQTRWLATGTVATKKGDSIEFDSGSTIDNFKSKTLNRTFPNMTFVNKVTVIKGN